jgi:GT2 family glycosyltransferase
MTSILSTSLPSGAANRAAIAQGPFFTVDNGPPNSLPADLAERTAPDNSAGVTVVPYQGNRGFGAGCNAGVAPADATPFILLVNPDAEITAGMVDELLATFAANPRLGIASPQLLDHTGTPVETAGTFPTVLGLALGKFRQAAHARQQQATAIHESGESQWRSGARSRVERIYLTAPITQTGHHIPVGNAFLPAFDKSYITTVTAYNSTARKTRRALVSRCHARSFGVVR